MVMAEILHHLGWLKPFNGIIIIFGGLLVARSFSLVKSMDFRKHLRKQMPRTSAKSSRPPQNRGKQVWFPSILVV